MASAQPAEPRSILRSSSMTDMAWCSNTSDDGAMSTEGDENRSGSAGGSSGGDSSDDDMRRWSSPGVRPGVRRSVSFADAAGGELERVRSIDRRPKRQGFLAQSLSIIKDEFLFSFRGALARESGVLEGAVPPDAATACADSEAERALFEAMTNTVLNVERVRAMAEQLP